MPDNVRNGSPIKKMTLGLRRPSESDDDTKRSFLPAMASKRTSRALQTAQGPSVPSGSTSRIAGKVRKNSISEAAAEIKEGSWLKSSKKTKAEKEAPKPPKRWNFFQRAHAGPRTATPAAPAVSPVNQATASRSVAHYALMDQSGLELDDIEQLMQEVDEGTESALSDDEPGRRERMQSMLLPPQSSDAVQLCSSYLTPVTDLSRPSSPFGEPSPVRDEDPAPPLEAVAPSQPEPEFAPEVPAQDEFVLPQDLPSPGPPPMSPPPRPKSLGSGWAYSSGRLKSSSATPAVFTVILSTLCIESTSSGSSSRTSFDSIGSVVASAGPVEPYPILHGLNALNHGSAIATISPMEDEANRRSEFFKFPPRKDSEAYGASPAIGTAVVPSPSAPLSEDELWNEYDDLIDEVLSPVTSRTNQDKNSLRSHPSLEPMPLRPKAPRNVSASDNDDEVTNPSLHLRRSRLLAVLHSTQSPTSSISFSEFISDYGERKISVIDPVTGRLSLPSSPQLSTGTATKRSTRSSLPASLSQSARQSKVTIASKSSKDRESIATNRYRDTRLMDIAERQNDGLLSMANLRFGALMTSKWLSFGRVLFSPVHFELKDPNEDRVLVIDGLGKDWSYYCALTYPEATVYDMGPDPSTSTSSEGASEPWSTLNNHRHICHPSLGKAFPFPMHFFACVVLRFPTALPSSEHRFILSEAKRVLRPGGYLEFSVLDMDLVNMGNRARRAVRGLKMRMQVADDSISLRNISDEVMAGIGRKGFVDSSTTSSVQLRRGRAAQASSASNTNKTMPLPKGPKPELSFSDLLNASASSDSTDNGITDMVARVGRWWYSRCYESLVLPEAGEPGAAASGNLLETSIWRDESLINECEKRRTSFKLLIGYAKKPEVGVRRTVSV
ncbi:unnamed protein product [Alternaria alternata]